MRSAMAGQRLGPACQSTSTHLSQRRRSRCIERPAPQHEAVSSQRQQLGRRRCCSGRCCSQVR